MEQYMYHYEPSRSQSFWYMVEVEEAIRVTSCEYYDYVQELERFSSRIGVKPVQSRNTGSTRGSMTWTTERLREAPPWRLHVTCTVESNVRHLFPAAHQLLDSICFEREDESCNHGGRLKHSSAWEQNGRRPHVAEPVKIEGVLEIVVDATLGRRIASEGKRDEHEREYQGLVHQPEDSPHKGTLKEQAIRQIRSVQARARCTVLHVGQHSPLHREQWRPLDLLAGRVWDVDWCCILLAKVGSNHLIGGVEHLPLACAHVVRGHHHCRHFEADSRGPPRWGNSVQRPEGIREGGAGAQFIIKSEDMIISRTSD